MCVAIKQQDNTITQFEKAIIVIHLKKTPSFHIIQALTNCRLEYYLLQIDSSFCGESASDVQKQRNFH